MDSKVLKDIVCDIIEQEKKDNNIDFEFYPVNIVNYYKSYVWNKKISLLNKMSLLSTPFYTMGFATFDGKVKDIVIFLGKYGIFCYKDNDIKDLVFTCYHEIRHIQQENFNGNSYENFIRVLESFNLSYSFEFEYMLYHDNTYLEIDANLYAITKTKDFLKTKYSDRFKEDEVKLKIIEEKVMLDYLRYDSSYTVDCFYQNIQKYKQVHDFDDIPEVFKIFYDKDFNYKEFGSIIRNEKFKTLDKRIITSVFASKSFLSSIDINKMSQEELETMLEYLNLANLMYQDEINLANKYVNNNFKEYLKLKKSILKKISILYNFCFDKIVKKLLFYKRESYSNKNMDDILDSLEKTKRLIKHMNNRGFVKIDLLYIVSLIISLITILYFIII